MKKTFLILIGIVIVGAGLAGAFFYWKNLRGVGPALSNPPGDIIELINTTGMPIKLPEGFGIGIFAKNLIAPRVIIFDTIGTLLTSITSEGKIIALPDKNNDHQADTAVILLQGLNRPHGIAIRCDGGQCKLYIAESNKISRYDYNPILFTATNQKKIADLPNGGNHYTRTIGFGPDERLYVSIGSTCNVCNEQDSMRAKMFSMRPDGSDFREFARGLRNAVFFTWDPTSSKMWATEMARDLLGDDIPPDEINIVEEGKNYGWPNCYGKNIHDTVFDKNTYIRNPCSEPFETPSMIDIQAHSAPLGLAFIPAEGWPEDYQSNLIVAYHGSWNRTVPTGYKIVRMKFDRIGTYLGAEDFISGWLDQKGAFGRPVAVLARPGGELYISDDKAGVIYRVHRIEGAMKDPSGQTSSLIHITNPKPNTTVTSPLMITGEARGFWFFEASFPIRLFDGNGKEMARTHGEAQGEWMTNNFVLFSATLTFVPPRGARGTLVLENDNPSGLPENAHEVRIPINF